METAIKPKERCRAAVLLPRHTGIQAETALDVLLRGIQETPLWTAANSPHECTRVRCDVSGICLSQLFLRAYHTLQSWSRRCSDRRRPVSASYSCSENARQEHFRGSYLIRQSVLRTGCFSTVTPLRTTPCPLMCVSWDRQHCRHHCETKTTCNTLHQGAAVHTRTG